jgi:hypothetical protein
MKIIWRNPNRVAQRPLSIVCTGGSNELGQVQKFYQSSSGVGILGTQFELWVNSEQSPHTELRSCWSARFLRSWVAR